MHREKNVVIVAFVVVVFQVCILKHVPTSTATKSCLLGIRRNIEQKASEVSHSISRR